MGRRPNPVFCKHFTRGAKIGNASNRYQWTCKQCGEHFAKGRVENLYNHLTISCSALTLKEKSDFALEIHQLRAVANAALAAKKKAEGEQIKEPACPFLPPLQHNLNGLNVLAEASRQVVATQYTYQPPFSSGNGIQGRPTVLDPALEVETYPKSFFASVNDGNAVRKNGRSSGISIPAVPSPPTLFPISVNKTAATTAEPEADSLISIAASANATLATSMVHNASALMDGYVNFSPGFPGVISAATQKTPNWLPATAAVKEAGTIEQHDKLCKQQMAAVVPYPIEIKPYAPAHVLPLESCQESSMPKITARASLSSARRKEIKKMREIGSCIRCKMLRKPCSDRTPCVTCSAIDSPRSWKGFPCIRGKLMDLYQGYMLGLHLTLSLHCINAAKSRMSFIPCPDKLLVQYLEDADPFVFSALLGSVTGSSNEPSLSMLSDGHAAMAETVIIDNEANDLPTVFEKYIQKEAPRFLAQESSPVIKSAAMLVYQYSQVSKDMLSQDVVELWISTTMLSDPNAMWKISKSQEVPPSSPECAFGQAAAIDRRKDQLSYTLICSQLLCGLERLAMKLSTHAMRKFGTRLLRPASTNQFETFLTAVLLINSIERHSWTFRSWADESKAVPWPLSMSPPALILQAEEVTNLIAFMIKVRNLTAQITEGGEGMVLKAEHTNDEKYAKWFEEIGVTVDTLTLRQDAVFDPSDCRSLDLKYSGTLLLPS